MLLTHWLFGIVLLHGQRVEIGFTGGVPLTGFFEENRGYRSDTRRYTAGPSLEVTPRKHWSLETGVLYKRFNYDYLHSPGFRQPPIPYRRLERWTTGNSYEVPLVLKTRFRLGVPLVTGAGVALRRNSGVFETERVDVRGPFDLEPSTTITQTDHPEDLSRRTAAGAVFVLGYERRFRGVSVASELRFTRWDSPRAGGSLTSGTHSNIRFGQNQAELVVNVSYLALGPRKDPSPLVIPWRRFGLEAGILAGFSIIPVQTRPLYDSTYYSFHNPPVAGAAFVEIEVSRSWSIEGAGVVKRFGYETRSAGSNLPLDKLRGTIWEVPFLIKRRLDAWRGWSVMTGAGLAMRRQEGVGGRSGFGYAGAAGVARRIGPLRYRVEMRYHYWTRPMYTAYLEERGSSSHSLFAFFGIGYSARSHRH